MHICTHTHIIQYRPCILIVKFKFKVGWVKCMDTDITVFSSATVAVDREVNNWFQELVIQIHTIYNSVVIIAALQHAK